MKRPPQAFIDEYWQMREHMQWAKSALGRGQDVPLAKTTMAEFRAFYDRWHPLIEDPELRAGMETMRKGMEESLGRHLELVFLTQLNDVIEARKDWFIAEELLKASISFIALMKEAPLQMRPELEKIHRDYMKKEFEPEQYYREAEADAAEEESKYRKALAGLETDWPERADAALRGRLEKLDTRAANAWQAEVSAKLNELESAPPAMARQEPEPE
ncbi:MAG TPA: hypothetical protein VMB22_09080 [Verrucomicrobiae bacterium]|nr:hypothetical protein [Verrucomicrobiae bacterium]